MSNKSGLWMAGFGEIGATLKALEDAGVTLEQFSRLRSDKKLAKEVASLIIGKSKSGTNLSDPDDIKLTVDYTKTVKQAIADGSYNWVNSDVSDKNFPTITETIAAGVTAKLFHFNCNINSEVAISEMDKAGYRPATLMELLVLGAMHPELQRQFPIVALGSVWRGAGGDRCVPYLDVDGSGRKLSLGWFDDDWYTHYRFLSVRK